MLKALITPQQSDIIKDICHIQIQSLIRVAMNKQVEEYLDKIGLEINKVNIDEAISEMLRSFDRVKDNPELLLSFPETQMSMFKHNLFTYDDRYSKNGYLPHKKNLWKKILITEEFRVSMLPN